MLRRLTFVLGLALLALGMTLPAAAQSNARVRIVHASPDAPAVDVFVGENAVATNVPFFTASDYLDLPAGQARVRIAPAGAGAAAAVIDATLTLAAGQAYTVAAVNNLANIGAEVYQDNLGAPSASNKARVRVYHMSPDAPAVDVKVAGGPTLIANLAFPDASAEAEVDAGAYNLQVTPAGASDVVIDLPNTQLQGGMYYSVFAVGPVAQIKAELKTFALPTAGSGGTPSTMPNTGAAEQLSMVLLALGAAALAGGMLLRRRSV